MRECRDCVHHSMVVRYDRSDHDRAYDLARCDLTGEETDGEMWPCAEWAHIDGLQDELRKMEDARSQQQQYIDEHYQLLPLDADGVPIRVGDYLQLGDTRGEVVALTYCPSNGELPWEWQCDTGDWHNTAFAHHVKPRTVEDVLGAAVGELFNADISAGSAEWDEVITKYADELRELMEVE